MWGYEFNPTLIHDNNEIKEDFDKANLFGSILRETFQDNNTSKFDQNFKKSVEEEMESFINDYVNDNKCFEFVN